MTWTGVPTAERPSPTAAPFTPPAEVAPVRPLPGRRGGGRRRAFVDAFALSAGAAFTVLEGTPLGGVAIVAAIACFVILALRGDYLAVDGAPLLARLWQAITLPATAGILHALAAAAAVGDAAAAPVLRAWATTAGMLVLSRMLLHWTDGRRRRAAHGMRRSLIVGAGVIGHRAARRLTDAPELGFKPVGFLDGDPLRFDANLPVLGADSDLEAVVREHGIDCVIVAFSKASNDELLQTVRRCWQLGVEVMLVPRLFEIEGSRTQVDHLGGLPIVRLAGRPLDGAALRCKYAVDRVLGGLLALAISPLLIALALAVRLTSPGPVFYRAQRTGAGGEPFEMIKFRTMVGRPEGRGEADSEWAERILLGLDGPVAEQTVDPDIYTPIGRFLRRTSLDELPQLWCVMRGDMSLIGPRPERVQYVERFAPTIYRYHERHRIRPGMTGWAQVNGLRGQTSLADRVEWDMFYLENWSPVLDMRILARTAQAAWRGTPGV